jgi:Raf kinase inhibitor-like YbhB/YbcL family protein
MYVFIFFMITWFQSATLTITSPDFDHEGEIPEQFTCDGGDNRPTLNVLGIPEGTKSLVVIMEDPDVTITTFNHWLVWNIPPEETISGNSVPGIQGNNSLGKNNYLGPCPPGGTHRYFFKVYALNDMLNLDPDSNKNKLERAMEGHVLAQGEIMGWYHKK